MSIVFKRLNDLKKVPRGWTLLGSFFQTLKSLRAGTLSLFSLVYFHHWVQCLAGRRWWVYICKEWTDRDFPGGPVVKTSRFHCRGIGLTPCWRTKILPATQCNQKKKKKVDRKTNEHNLQCSRLQELEPWAEGMRTAVQVSGYLAKQWVLWFGDIGGWLGFPHWQGYLAGLGDSPFQPSCWTPALNWQMENIFTGAFLAGRQTGF